jgi:hypothetical protein
MALDLRGQRNSVLDIRHALMNVNHTAQADRAFDVVPDILRPEVFHVPRDPRVEDFGPLQIVVSRLNIRYDSLDFLPNQPLIKLFRGELLETNVGSAK